MKRKIIAKLEDHDLKICIIDILRVFFQSVSLLGKERKLTSSINFCELYSGRSRLYETQQKKIMFKKTWWWL